MPHVPRRPGVATAASLALSLALLAGCSIEDPELPSFESEWSIPLGVLDKTIEELVADEEDFVIAEDGTIRLTTSGELDAVGVGDQLDVSIDGIDFSAEIGAIRLDATDPIGFAHRLGDLYSGAEALNGLTMPVPGFTFGLDSDPQDLPGFRSARLSTGGLQVHVVNGLPVPVGGTSAPEQLVIRLVDPLDGTSIVDFVVADAIAPGATYDDVIDLAGQALPDSVGVRLDGGSPGSGGQPVTIDADSELVVEVRTTALEVIEAEAEFGAQSFQDTSRVSLPDSIRVLDATVESGALVVSLRNDLPVPTQADIVVPVFVDAQQQPLRISVPLPPSSLEQRSVDLTQYALHFEGMPGESFDVIAELSTPGSGTSSVNIRATDVVAVNVAPLSLRFGRVTGVIDPMEIEIDPSVAEIQIPEDLEDMRLQTAELVLGFRSSLGMPITVDLHLEGTNAQGEMVPLETTVELPATSGNAPQSYSRVLNRDNSGIVDFLNNLPTQVSFRGTARVGDGVTIGSIASTDSVSARWSISAPLTVAVQAQEFESDAELLDLDEEVRNDIERRLVELTIEAEVTSTLPLAATAYVGIDTDSTAVFTTPDLRLGPIEIPAAGPAAAGGVRTPTVVRSTVTVAREDVPLITRAGAWQGLFLSVPGTNGEFVTLRASDKVEVRGFLRARVLIGEVD